MHCGNTLQFLRGVTWHSRLVDYSTQGGRDRIKMHFLPEEFDEIKRNEYKVSIIKYALDDPANVAIVTMIQSMATAQQGCQKHAPSLRRQAYGAKD